MLHLNDHLYSKLMCLLWVANFRGLIASFARLPILSRAFTVGHICIKNNNESFTKEGIYLYYTYFHFHICNRVTLLDVVPQYRVHHQTPNAVLIHTMHSHLFHAMAPCICNAMSHFMAIPCHIYDECYIDNSTYDECLYSQLFHAMSPCICNAMCHFMPMPCHIYDECYIDNSTHAYHPCIMDNYINQYKISKRSHISCQYICTHIY